jgi:hypothetical protein
MSKIHVCIVSQQVLPNLIPVLSDENVSGFILFAGDSTQKKQGRRLKNILESKNIECIKSVNAKNSFDYGAILAVAQKLRQQLARDYADSTWVINITNGTKVMSLALHNAFYDATQVELIYVDTQNGAIRYMSEQQVPIPMKSVIDLPTYMAAQNFIMTENPAYNVDDIDYMQNRRFLIDKVYKPNFGRMWLLSTIFNRSGSEAIKKKCLIQPISNKIKSDAIPLMSKLEDAGLFVWDRDKNTLSFENEETAFFLAGGWLEEYAYWCAVDAGATDIGINVKGYWDKDVSNNANNKPTNEFDLLLCHQNQLMVIECKTMANINEGGKGQDIVNKIEALGSNLGGLFGKSMLLSTSKVSEDDDYSQHIASRLRSYKIDVMHSRDLHNLTDKIKQWMRSCESNIVVDTSVDLIPTSA